MRTTSGRTGRVSRNALTVLASGAAAALSVVVFATACGHSSTGTGKNGTGNGALGGSPGAGDLGQASAQSGMLGTGGHPSGSASASGASGGGTPQIVSFAVTGDPACPRAASSDAPFSRPAKDVTLSWQVTGATGIALSIDDPNFFAAHHVGTFGSYPAKSSVTLNFACDQTKHTSTHVYTINTLGSEPSVSRSITVTVSSNS